MNEVNHKLTIPPKFVGRKIEVSVDRRSCLLALTKELGKVGIYTTALVETVIETARRNEAFKNLSRIQENVIAGIKKCRPLPRYKFAGGDIVLGHNELLWSDPYEFFALAWEIFKDGWGKLKDVRIVCPWEFNYLKDCYVLLLYVLHDEVLINAVPKHTLENQGVTYVACTYKLPGERSLRYAA